MRTECDVCGIAAVDLPDGIDPELIFETDDQGVTRCQGCQCCPGCQGELT